MQYTLAYAAVSVGLTVLAALQGHSINKYIITAILTTLHFRNKTDEPIRRKYYCILISIFIRCNLFYQTTYEKNFTHAPLSLLDYPMELTIHTA